MDIDKSMGMIFGLAIGDALGRPTEFMSLKNIQSKYGPEGIQDLPEQALYTDDTQMTIAIAEALIKVGDQDLETIMDAVRDAFISWRHSPENNRAPGNACLTGVSNMEKGIHWSKVVCLIEGLRFCHAGGSHRVFVKTTQRNLKRWPGIRHLHPRTSHCRCRKCRCCVSGETGAR